MTATDFQIIDLDPMPRQRPDVLPAERLDDGTGRVRVLCPYCSRARGKPSYHYHGDDGTDGPFNACAPCATAYGVETPFSRTGYTLMVVEPVESDPRTRRG